MENFICGIVRSCMHVYPFRLCVAALCFGFGICLTIGAYVGEFSCLNDWQISWSGITVLGANCLPVSEPTTTTLGTNCSLVLELTVRTIGRLVNKLASYYCISVYPAQFQSHPTRWFGSGPLSLNGHKPGRPIMKQAGQLASFETS